MDQEDVAPGLALRPGECGLDRIAVGELRLNLL